MSCHYRTQAGDLPRQPYNAVNGNDGSTNPPPFSTRGPFSSPIRIRKCCELGDIVGGITEPCFNLVETGPYILIRNEVHQNEDSDCSRNIIASVERASNLHLSEVLKRCSMRLYSSTIWSISLCLDWWRMPQRLAPLRILLE